MQRLSDRGRSQPTLDAYRADLGLYARFVARRAGVPLDELTIADCAEVGVRSYLGHLRDDRHNRSATISRRLAALRALYGCSWLAAGLVVDPWKSVV